MLHSELGLRGTLRQQLDFMRFGSPGAALIALLVFGVYDLFDPSTRMHLLLGLLAVALVVAGLGVLALRRWPVGLVTRATLAVDIGLIAVMIAVLGEDALLVLPYYGPLAFSALLFGVRETAAATLLGVVAGAVVGVIIDANPVTIVASCLVLAITGAILGWLSHGFHRAERELAAERAADAAALRITARIRSSLNLDEVLQATVEELGPACEADRCLLRLAPQPSGSGALYEWHRDELSPWHPASPPAFVQRVVEAAEPISIADVTVRGIDLPAGLAARSIVGYPIVWQDRVVAVLALTDDRSRDWSKRALPLLDRVAPQIGAALVQAELFAEQQATAALREELVANVSHELRTPLTSTIGFLRTLERTDVVFTEEQQARFVHTARMEAERLAGLVDDLLDLTRLQRGVFPLEPRPVELEELVARAAVGLELPAGREIQVEVDPALSAHADPERLVQVISNLLSNALKHGHGAVAVSGARRNGNVYLKVSDEGPGVPHERIRELFLPFARWGGASESTGLGLAIARGIVEAHGGSLEYRPADNGSSHAFVVTLPAGG
jgi:signal transduction histidine kinase